MSHGCIGPPPILFLINASKRALYAFCVFCVFVFGTFTKGVGGLYTKSLNLSVMPDNGFVIALSWSVMF